MNLHRLVKWADQLLHHSTPGRAQAGSALAQLRAALDRLPACKSFITLFRRDAEALLQCQSLLKVKGLSHDTRERCQSLVDVIPPSSPVRLGVERGMDKHLGAKPTVIDPAIISRIDHLSEQHTAGEVAMALNEAGIIHPTRGDFDTNAVVYLLNRFELPSRYQRLHAQGYWSQEEVAEQFGVRVKTVKRWRKLGWINAAYYNEQKEYLYEPFFEGLPQHYQTSAASPLAQS